MPFRSTLERVAPTGPTAMGDAPSNRSEHPPRNPPNPAGAPSSKLLSNLHLFIRESETWDDYERLFDAVDAALRQDQLDAKGAISLVREILARYRSVTDLRIGAFSRVLNENVLLVANDTTVRSETAETSYSESELNHLTRKSDHALKMIHKVKKVMDGEIIRLPERGGITIPVEAIIEPSTCQDHCRACGQKRWWTRDGRRICQICHPPPQQRSEETNSHPDENRNK